MKTEPDAMISHRTQIDNRREELLLLKYGITNYMAVKKPGHTSALPLRSFFTLRSEDDVEAVIAILGRMLRDGQLRRLVTCFFCFKQYEALQYMLIHLFTHTIVSPIMAKRSAMLVRLAT